MIYHFLREPAFPEYFGYSNFKDRKRASTPRISLLFDTSEKTSVKERGCLVKLLSSLLRGAAFITMNPCKSINAHTRVRVTHTRTHARAGIQVRVCDFTRRICMQVRISLCMDWPQLMLQYYISIDWNRIGVFWMTLFFLAPSVCAA